MWRRRQAASVLSGPDKFLKTDLEKILKDKGITTVIAVGTSSNGAVLYTGSGAALRGMEGVEATFQGHRGKDKNKRVMKAERIIIKGKLYNLYPDRD